MQFIVSIELTHFKKSSQELTMIMNYQIILCFTYALSKSVSSEYIASLTTNHISQLTEKQKQSQKLRSLVLEQIV